MKAGEIFEIIIKRRNNCKVQCRKHNYAVVSGSYHNGAQYNILSDALMSQILSLEHSTSFLMNNTANWPIKNNMPRIFNQTLCHTEASDSCVTRAIVCLFPYSCILSHDDDPLLLRIEELYDRLISIYRETLPGAGRDPEFTARSVAEFIIPQAYCHWYDGCFGMDTEPINAANSIKLSAFGRMKNSSQHIKRIMLNITGMRGDIECKPMVSICNSSGKCRAYLFSQLFDELQKADNYTIANLNFTFSAINKLQFQADFPEKLYNTTGTCPSVYLYGDPTGRFLVLPEEYGGWLVELLQRYFQRFEFAVQKFSDIFMVNREYHSFCTGEIPSTCLSLKFRNKLINDTSKIPKLTVLNKVNYIVDMPEIIFRPPIIRTPRSVKEQTENIVRNDRETKPSTSKLLILVFGDILKYCLFVLLIGVLFYMITKNKKTKHTSIK